jgi:drug/metabolite transporter (DMT)-like permease
MACYGGIDFLQKAAALADSPSRLVVRTTAIVVALMSLVGVLISKSSFANIEDILIFAGINSTFFAIGSMARITALKKIPAAYVFPLAKTSAVLLILISVIFFGDRPDVWQWAGIVLSVSLVLIVGRGISSTSSAHENLRFPHAGRFQGFLLALAAASCTTITIIAGKYASTRAPHLSFMFVSYSLVVGHTFLIERIFLREKSIASRSGANQGGDPLINGDEAIAGKVCTVHPINDQEVGSKTAPTMQKCTEAGQEAPASIWDRHPLESSRRKRAMLFGAGIGALNFFGYLAVLSAFAGGPLALIQGISSTSFVIPIVLSAIVFGERLDTRRSIIVALAVVSVILQR